MKLPSMPMFWGDFFNDTALKLTGEEAAFYAILLGHAWMNGGSLPDNDAMIANVLRVTPRKWTALKGPIMGFWHKDQKGNWTQNRLNREYNYVAKKVEINRANGMNGGRPTSAKIPKDINKTAKPPVIPGLGEGLSETVTDSKANLHPYLESESSSSKDARESKPPNGGDDDDEIRKLKVKEALGDKTRPSVAKAVFPAIRQLIEEGCDFERDVLPKLRDIAISGLKTPYPEFLGKQIREGRDARLARERDDANRPPLVFVRIETPQWEAWQAHRGGKSPPVNREGTGWFFPTEWPPGVGPAPAAARPPPASAANPNPAVLH